MHAAGGTARPVKDSHKGSSQLEKHVQLIAHMQAMRVPVSATQYVAAIKACCKLLRPEDALALWCNLKASGAGALVGTYACVMSGFIKTKQWERALELYINIVNEPFDANIIIYNAAISAATNLGLLDLAEEIYSRCEAAADLDIVTFTVITSTRALSGEWWKVFSTYYTNVLPSRRPDIVFLLSVFEALWYAGSALAVTAAVMIYADARASKFLFEVPDYHSGPAELMVTTSTVASCELYTFTWMAKIRQLVHQHGAVLPSMQITLYKQCRKFALRFWQVLYTRMSAYGCPCTASDKASELLSLTWSGDAITSWLRSEASAVLNLFMPDLPLSVQLQDPRLEPMPPHAALMYAVHEERTRLADIKQRAQELQAYSRAHPVRVSAMPQAYLAHRSALCDDIRTLALYGRFELEDWYNGLSTLDWIASHDSPLRKDLLADCRAALLACTAAVSCDGDAALAAVLADAGASPDADAHAGAGADGAPNDPAPPLLPAATCDLARALVPRVRQHLTGSEAERRASGAGAALLDDISHLLALQSLESSPLPLNPLLYDGSELSASAAQPPADVQSVPTLPQVHEGIEDGAALPSLAPLQDSSFSQPSLPRVEPAWGRGRPPSTSQAPPHGDGLRDLAQDVLAGLVPVALKPRAAELPEQPSADLSACAMSAAFTSLETSFASQPSVQLHPRPPSLQLLETSGLSSALVSSGSGLCPRSLPYNSHSAVLASQAGGHSSQLAAQDASALQTLAAGPDPSSLEHLPTVQHEAVPMYPAALQERSTMPAGTPPSDWTTGQVSDARLHEVRYASPHACLQLMVSCLSRHAGLLTALAAELASLVLQETVRYAGALEIAPWETAAVVIACCRTACGAGWGHARVLTSLFGLPVALLDAHADLVRTVTSIIHLKLGLQLHTSLLQPTVHEKAAPSAEGGGAVDDSRRAWPGGAGGGALAPAAPTRDHEPAHRTSSGGVGTPPHSAHAQQLQQQRLRSGALTLQGAVHAAEGQVGFGLRSHARGPHSASTSHLQPQHTRPVHSASLHAPPQQRHPHAHHSQQQSPHGFAHTLGPAHSRRSTQSQPHLPTIAPAAFAQGLEPLGRGASRDPYVMAALLEQRQANDSMRRELALLRQQVGRQQVPGAQQQQQQQQVAHSAQQRGRALPQRGQHRRQQRHEGGQTWHTAPHAQQPRALYDAQQQEHLQFMSAPHLPQQAPPPPRRVLRHSANAATSPPHLHHSDSLLPQFAQVDSYPHFEQHPGRSPAGPYLDDPLAPLDPLTALDPFAAVDYHEQMEYRQAPWPAAPAPPTQRQAPPQLQYQDLQMAMQSPTSRAQQILTDQGQEAAWARQVGAARTDAPPSLH